MSDNQRGLKVEFNIFALRRQLELAKGKSVTWLDIAESTGLHHNTLYNLSDNRTARVDLKTLGKLLMYFRQEGLDVELGHLFRVVESEEQ